MRPLSLLALAVGILVFTTPIELPGCGGGPPSAIFVLSRQPEKPKDEFARGKLGILQPDYDKKYLVIAYRFLTGGGLTDAQRAAIFDTQPTTPGDPTPWNEALAKLPVSPAAGLTPYRTVAGPGALDFPLNCNSDAFRTAAVTLSDRASAFGRDSALLREWVEGQIAVFANCAGGNLSLPQPTSDPQLRADRGYQIAAAKFYARQFDEARDDFERIAQDQQSPWRASAPYLAARCFIRAGKFSEADERLARMLADPSFAAWHDRARRLRDYVALHTRPADRLRELGQALAAPDPGANFPQDLTDYCWSQLQLTVEPDDDLSAWIAAFRGRDSKTAVEKWRATHSLPWLVAALQNALSTDAPDLLAAAREVPQSSPGYVMVSYYSLKHLAAPDARETAARLLRTDMPVSSRNLILAERMHLARNWNEYLRDAIRQPVGETTIDGDAPIESSRRYLDVEAGLVLNSAVPLATLKDVASNSALPAHIRDELARTAFARSVLLSRNPDFAGILKLLRSPGISPWVRSGFGRRFYRYDPDVKVLDNIPERIEPTRDNWWTPAKPGVAPLNDIPAFLTDADRQTAAVEWKMLAAIPSGVDWLGARTLAFAAAHPDDPRVPEALHLVVRASRYSIPDEHTGDFSHRAFTLLHRCYPDTEWAHKTPYWFR
jgi:hypothetical protein